MSRITLDIPEDSLTKLDDYGVPTFSLTEEELRQDLREAAR